MVGLKTTTLGQKRKLESWGDEEDTFGKTTSLELEDEEIGGSESSDDNVDEFPEINSDSDSQSDSETYQEIGEDEDEMDGESSRKDLSLPHESNMSYHAF